MGEVRRIAWLGGPLTALVRLPFVAHRLWDHDSVQFALAVGHFDLAAHHPHPPGYPLYVGLLDLLALVGVSPLAGMVALSIVAEGLGAAFFALLADRLVREAGGEAPTGRAAALLAIALYATNPLLWFYGELPLVYAVEAGLTVALAWAALRMVDGRGPFLAACAGFGLAGGVRPSTLVLLGPLFAFGLLRAVWRTRARSPGGRDDDPSVGRPMTDGGPGGALASVPRDRGVAPAGATSHRWPASRGGTGLSAGTVVVGGLLAVAAVAVWLVPLIRLAGGLAAYRHLSGEHFATLLPQTSVLYGAGWPALRHNLEVLLKWAAQGALPGALAVLVAGCAAPRRLWAGCRLLGRSTRMLAAWAVPPVLFFALFHVTKAGYTLIHLPALLLAAALLAAPAAAVGRGRRVAVVGTATLVGAGLFLFGADRRPDQPRALAIVRHEHNRGAIATSEHDLDELLATLHRYPPGETVLATVELSGSGGAAAEGFLYPYQRHLQWYAPAYELLFLVPEQGFAEVTPGGRQDFHRVAGRVELPAGTRRLLFVLSGPLGDRLHLPPAQVVLANHGFRALAVPFRDELEIGDRLRLVRAAGHEERVPARAVAKGGGPRPAG